MTQNIASFRLGLAAAQEAARMSECSRGAYGACLMSPNGEIFATGANRIVGSSLSCLKGGCPHAIFPTDPSAQCLATHAEAACIHSAGPMRSQGATIATTGTPCQACAGAIGGSHIAILVLPGDISPRWDWEESRAILNSADVMIIRLD